MDIIPAILESSWPEVEKKTGLIGGASSWIQLDVSDGLFAPNKTWGNSQDLFLLKTDSKIEIHLMVAEPWLKANEWLSSPAKRIVAHVEAFSSPESVKFGEIMFLAKKYGKEVFWGFKIETPWEPYRELIKDFGSGVLLLGVDPGYQGQEFNSKVLEKIKSLKSAYSRAKVLVDGGINSQNITEIAAAGADAAVVGSAIFSSADPLRALNELKNVL